MHDINNLDSRKNQCTMTSERHWFAENVMNVQWQTIIISEYWVTIAEQFNLMALYMKWSQVAEPLGTSKEQFRVEQR